MLWECTSEMDGSEGRDGQLGGAADVLEGGGDTQGTEMASCDPCEVDPGQMQGAAPGWGCSVSQAGC